jgi:hypothetical protein
MGVDISVIIPSNHDHNDLIKVVKAVCNQTIKPYEILIIDSSEERGVFPEDINTLCEVNSIVLTYIPLNFAMPGRARNIGIELVKSKLIALIDVQTIPKHYWLEVSLNLLTEKEILGVWGHTFFNANTVLERLVRDCFYGIFPRKTLPGSIFKREVFHKVGQFIDWVRAGEDTEWMLRLELLKTPVAHPSIALVDYIGLIGTSRQWIKKWCRNYSASRNLPHFFPQRLLLWFVLYPLLLLIAFNWNFIIADWRIDSPFYIGHITKIIAFTPILIYISLRGLILPLKRGVSILDLLPIRFIGIILVCLIADFLKILMFSIPKKK